MKVSTNRLVGLAVAAVLVCGLAFGIVRAATAGDAAACSAGRSGTPGKALRLEGDPWSGYAAFRDPAFLKEGGYSLTYATQLDQAVRACNLSKGNTDFMVTTVDQYLSNKPDGKIVAIVDQSAGADALVLSTPGYPYLTSIDRLSQLVRDVNASGKKPVLAYTGNSPSDFLLTEISGSSEDLRLSDFELVSVDQSATAWTKLRNREAQVAVLWEPDVSAARKAGYTVAASSKDFPDAIVDVLVASNRIIEKDPQAVQLVVNKFYAARAAAVANPAKFEADTAKDGDFSAEDTHNLLAGIRFYTAREADAFINTRAFPLGQTRLHESLDSIGALLSIKDPTIKPSTSMWDGRFVQNAP